MKIAVYLNDPITDPEPLFLARAFEAGGLRLLNGRFATKPPLSGPHVTEAERRNFHLTDEGPPQLQAATSVGAYEKCEDNGRIVTFDPGNTGKPFNYPYVEINE